jgi:hypothetical protein
MYLRLAGRIGRVSTSARACDENEGCEVRGVRCEVSNEKCVVECRMWGLGFEGVVTADVCRFGV